MALQTKKERTVSESSLLQKKDRAFKKANEAELDLLDAKAREVFDALNKDYNVRYDLQTYTVKEGENAGQERKIASVQINGSGPKKEDPSQLISLNIYLADGTGKDKDGNEFSYKAGDVSVVKVQSFDANTKKWNDVKVPQQYDSVKKIRTILEEKGICREFLTKPFEKTERTTPDTPVYALRSAFYDAIEKANEGVAKVKNSKGEEVSEYYASGVQETTGKDGAKYEAFAICNHKSQQVEFTFKNDELIRASIKDLSKAVKGQKDSVERKDCLNADYLKSQLDKLDLLDSKLKEIVNSVPLNFKPYVKGDKGNDGTEMDEQFPDLGDER